LIIASPVEKAFALMLETACDDFSILQALLNGELRLTCSGEEFESRMRAMRSTVTIQMSLAKSFVAHTARARRSCEHGGGELKLDRLERTRFLKATEMLTHVRDVNEHGFDADAKSKPTLHPQAGGVVDETSLAILGPTTILMGPINLHTVYIAVDRMRKRHWFAAAAGVIIVVIGPLILIRPKPKRKANTTGSNADSKEWVLTGRIDFVDPHSAGELVLQVEETRIVNSPSGVEHREIRWRRAILDEGKMVLVSYHAQRNLLMSPNYTVSASTNTRQNTNGQAGTADTKLKDEGHGEGRVDVKPIAPEV
jgi:hypothetical protein